MHKKAFSYLTYGLEKGTDFVQLTGEIGCGKTTLILTLLKNFSPDVNYAYVVDPRLSFPALLRTFLSQLGLKANGSEEPKDILLANFQEYLKEQSASGKRVLLIVDEAQNIDPAVLEELRMLSNIDTGRQRPMQMIFVGQSEFRTLIANPNLAALKQRITLATHLSPLDMQETARYISHRLKLAGASDVPAFTPKAINKIFGFSKGIPRLINLACEASLLAGYVEEKTRLNEHLVGAVLKELEEDFKSPTSSPKGPTPQEAHTKRVLTLSEPATADRPSARPHSHTEAKEVQKTRQKGKLTIKGFFKSKKSKIAFLTAISSLCAIGLGFLAYFLSR
ncbi:MAG TPA: ExeA family protein [Candidatus Hypogeohydataceae bacterium YC41]